MNLLVVKHSNYRWLIFIIMGIFIANGAYLNAQTDAGYFQGFQLDPVLSGARSVGMGDSATANGYDIPSSRINPANLINFPKSVVEINISNITLKRTIYSDKFESSVTNPANFGVVFNYGQLAFSFYQQKLYRFKEDFAVLGSELPLGGRTPNLNGSRDIDITTRGFTIALLLDKDLAVGVGFDRSSLRFKANSLRTTIMPNPVYDEINTMVDTTDNDSAWSLGVLMSPKSEFSVGLAYRFKYRYGVTENRFFMKDNVQVGTAIIDYYFWIPAQLNAGFSYKMSKRFTVAFDYINKYRKKILNDGFKAVEVNANAANFVVGNTREYHLGLEYNLPFKKTYNLYIRGGLNHIPGHAIAFTGSTGDLALDEILKVMYPEGNEVYAATFGSGANINSRSYIDVAFVYSSLRKDFVITSGFLF